MDFLRRAKTKGNLMVGSLVLLAVIILSTCAPILVEHGPLVINPRERLSPPFGDYFLGTDNMGRDLYSRVMYGARLSLLIGFSVALLSSFFGVVVGLLTGYFDPIDKVVMRILDGLMAFPAILLAIALMATFGPSPTNVVIALTVVFFPRTARVVRSGVLTARTTAYVEAARASGATHFRIMFRHILPNCMGPLIVQSTFILAQSMLVESSLSFLGVGVPPYHATWGNVMTGGRLVMRTAPWVIIVPGIAIVVTVLAVNMMGDGLRDVLDPHEY